MIGCGGDPRTRLTDEDRAAVAEFKAWLAARQPACATCGHPRGHHHRGTQACNHGRGLDGCRCDTYTPAQEIK